MSKFRRRCGASAIARVAGRRRVDSAGVFPPVRPSVLLGFAALVLALPAVASAKEPPNQNDPCSSGGRNTCGTLGIGFYDTYRTACAGSATTAAPCRTSAHTFCIDLQLLVPVAEVPLQASRPPTR